MGSSRREADCLGDEVSGGGKDLERGLGICMRKQIKEAFGS